MVVLGTVIAVFALTGVSGAFAVPASSADEAASVARDARPKLHEVDGGLGYYGQFASPLPTSAAYFPIGVWGAYSMERRNIAKDKAVGLNTYVWFADTTTPDYIENARAAGMHLIVNRSDGGSRIGSETFGRLLGDEIDMTQGPSACPNAINAVESSLPNDGRARYANYGKGVLIWSAIRSGSWTDAAAACFVNSQDITSTDLYWHTDPYETDHPQSGMSSGYGWSMRRMRALDALDGVRRPQWGFVEVTNAMDGPWGPPTPAEIRAAVWHTLIAGARGIIYFQHDFNGDCQTHHALRETGTACYGAAIGAVSSVNRQIKRLARVLNAPFVTSRHKARDKTAGTVRYMVKWANGKFWVVAGADRGGGKATFTIRCVGDARAKVVFENRSIPVRRGSFTDTFADKDAIHIYRIDGGSNCRLK